MAETLPLVAGFAKEKFTTSSRGLTQGAKKQRIEEDSQGD
jgi:hypothetical protein